VAEAQTLSLSPLEGVVVREALAAGVNPALALSLIHQESGFDPSAQSPTGVQGLAQVTNATGAAYGQTPQTRTDPQVSARAGLQHFRQLLDANRGDVGAALMQYNGGSDPNFTQNVLQHYPRYAHLAGLRPGPPAQQVAQAQPASSPYDAVNALLPSGSQAPAPTGTPQEGSPYDAVNALLPAEPEKYGEGSVTATIEGAGDASPPVASQASQVEPLRPIPPETFREATGVGGGPKQLAAEAVQIAGGMGGAALGSLVGFPTVGAAAGGIAANWLNKGLELTQPEQPLMHVGPVPINLSDVAAVAIPGLFKGAETAGLRYLRQGPAAQAVRTAEQQTFEAQQAWQKSVDALRDARQKGDAAAYAAALKEAKSRQRDYARSMQDYTKTNVAEQRAFEAGEALKQKEYAGELKDYTKETAAGEATYQKQVGEYGTAWEKQQAFDRAQQAQQEAATRLESFPEQYKPQAPARTPNDVRLDMARLEQGGAASEAVLRRLGAPDVATASRMLADEGGALYAQTGSMGTKPQPAVRPAVPVVGREPQMPTGEPAQELQAAIKELGGISLGKEPELGTEFYHIISKREGGKETARLLNQNGLTPDQMAEELMQRGYDIHDKGSLLDAVRASVEEGRPVYSTHATLEAPQFHAMAEAPQVSVGGKGRLSSQMYQRYFDIAGGASVDQSPVQEAIAGMQKRLEYADPKFQTLVGNIAKEGPGSTGKQAYENIKALGPYTRSGNRATREAANELFGKFYDSLGESIPDQLPLLQQAHGVWKQEQGVNEMHRILENRGRGGVMRQDDQGRLMVDIAGVLNKLTSKDVLRWFPPEEQAAIRADVASFAGTPAMPRGTRPQLPVAPVAPTPGIAPVAPIPGTPPVPGLPPPRPPAVQVPGQGPLVLPPVPPALEPTLGARPQFNPLTALLELGGAAGAQHIPVIGPMFGHLPIAAVVAKEAIPQVNYLLSQAFLSPTLRPWLLGAIDRTGGILTPEIVGGLSGALGAMRERLRQKSTDAADGPVDR